MNSRIDRDEMFMAMADLVSQRSTCLRRHVGCVIVKDRRIISMGYNGSPPGQPHCDEVGCQMLGGAELGCQRTVHAEANAVAFAARMGVPVLQATLYTTDSPCRPCAMLLGSAGIAEVMYRTPYRDTTPLRLLEEMGVKVLCQPQKELDEESAGPLASSHPAGGPQYHGDVVVEETGLPELGV